MNLSLEVDIYTRNDRSGCAPMKEGKLIFSKKYKNILFGFKGDGHSENVMAVISNEELIKILQFLKEKA